MDKARGLRLVLWIFLSVFTIAVGLRIFPSVIADWNSIMLAIGIFVTYCGCALAVILWATAALPFSVALWVLTAVLQLLVTIQLGLDVAGGFGSAQRAGHSVLIAALVFHVLSLLLAVAGIFIARHFRSQVREQTPQDTMHSIPRGATVAWAVFAGLGGAFLLSVSAVYFFRIASYSATSSYQILSFITAIVNAVWLALLPYGATAMLLCFQPKVKQAQMNVFAAGGAFPVLGWMLYVVPAVFIPIDISIDDRTIPATVWLNAIAGVCFVIGAIGYDVSFRRIRRYIKRYGAQTQPLNNASVNVPYKAPPQDFSSGANGYSAVPNSNPPQQSYQQYPPQPQYQQAQYQQAPPQYQQAPGNVQQHNYGFEK